MEYGFSVPTRGPLATMENISSIVTAGEELGFHIASVSDHIVIPTDISSVYPYSKDGVFLDVDGSGECLEQLTTITAVAALTSRIRLLTSVMVLPYRNPVFTAKVLASIDVLSDGRLNVGCGVGWMKEEFVALNTPSFNERGAVASEYIEVFKELWMKDKPAYEGKYCNFSDITFLPQPIQKPHPPIWVGGESLAALKRAALLGDCWFPIGANPRFPLGSLNQLRARINKLYSCCESVKRDPASIKLAYSIPWYLNSSVRESGEKNRLLMTGTDEEIAEDIDCLENIGVSYIQLNLSAHTVSKTVDNMSGFMTDVAQKLKRADH